MGQHSIKKDKKTRNYAKKNELRLLLLKYQLNSLDKKIKLIFHFKHLKKFHLNSSSSRIVNMCMYTGRSHWVLRKFKLSRMSFKKLADFGQLNGIKRSC